MTICYACNIYEIAICEQISELNFNKEQLTMTDQADVSHEFTLVITGTENYDWQGTLLQQNGGSRDFLSLLELIKAIESELEKAP